MFQIMKVEILSRINYLKNMRASTILALLFLSVIIVFAGPGIIISLFFIVVSMNESLIAPSVTVVTVSLIIFLSLLTVNKIVKDLFMNRNMVLYMTFPVTAGQLFTAKSLMQLSTGILPVTVITGLFFGIALSVRENNVAALFSSLSYMFLISAVILGITYIIVFFVTKVSKPGRVSEVLTLAGGLIGVLPYLIITFGTGNFEQVLSKMPDMSVLFNGFLYNIDPLKTAAGSVAALLFGVLVLYIVTRLVSSAFIKGALSVSRTGKVKSSEAAVSSPVISLLSKDLTMSRRDFKEWAAVLPQYFLPFIIYYVGVFQMDTLDAEIGASLIAVSVTGTVIISLFVSALNTARDAAHYEMLQILPVRPKDIATAKYLYNIITIIPVYLVLSAAAFMIADFSVVNLLLSWLCIIFTALTVIPVGMLIGASTPVVNKKQPTDRIGIAANVMIIIVMLVFVFATGIFARMFVDASGSVAAGGVLIFTAVLAVTGIISYIMVLKRVSRVYDRGLIIEYKG